MRKLSRNLGEKEEIGSWLLSRADKIIFCILLLFLPTQFGKHFWPDFSYISGIRIDYLSPTLYATDVLIFLIFILSVAKSKISNLKSQINYKFLKSKFPIITFTLCLIVGVVFSKSPQVGFYGSVKLFEFVFLGIYTAKNIHRLKFQNILLMFSSGILFESFLSVAQFLNHGSLQGIFYFFGERLFNSQTPGIANAVLDGALVLRPYGTFPHPNVLAGYLVVGMTLIISNIKYQISNIKKIIFGIALSVGTIAIFLTLSRVAILLWLIVLGSWFIVKIKNKKSNLKIIICILVVLVCIGSIILTTPLGVRFTELKLTDESVVQRKDLVGSSVVMIKDHPILGVGLNNFLVNLPISAKPQPVHNIFLLVFAETGIMGFSFFIWFLLATIKRIRNYELRIKDWPMFRNSLFIILSAVLILGMFDHYFLTLQQGQLLLSFILGLCWARRKNMV